VCSDPERGNPKISEREYQVLIARWSYNKKKALKFRALKVFSLGRRS
jgi:hypothetical protein